MSSFQYHRFIRFYKVFEISDDKYSSGIFSTNGIFSREKGWFFYSITLLKMFSILDYHLYLKEFVSIGFYVFKWRE